MACARPLSPSKMPAESRTFLQVTDEGVCGSTGVDRGTALREGGSQLHSFPPRCQSGNCEPVAV
jgi:hypothetical protein